MGSREGEENRSRTRASPLRSFETRANGQRPHVALRPSLAAGDLFFRRVSFVMRHLEFSISWGDREEETGPRCQRLSTIKHFSKCYTHIGTIPREVASVARDGAIVFPSVHARNIRGLRILPTGVL